MDSEKGKKEQVIERQAKEKVEAKERSVKRKRIPRVELLRKFLASNKIFFETLAASLLSLMAIIISSAQIFIAIKQNNLTETQTEIARQQIIPQFVINAEQFYDPVDKFVKNEKILVDNKGGIVYDLHVENAIFFDVDFSTNSPEFKKKEISINGYYDSAMYTGQNTGTVVRLEGQDNNQKLSQLLKDYRELAASQKASGNIEIRRYIRLIYRDTLGTFHTKYYFVDTVNGGRDIDPEIGSSIFDKYKNAYKNSTMVEFDNLTSNKLIELLNQ